MAGVTGGGGSHGDSKLNVELNLVPFIDLLSALVLFLLITAVWLQISAIPAQVQSRGKSTVSSDPQNVLDIRLTSKGYQLTWPNSISGPRSIGISKGSYNTEALEAALAKVAAKIPTASVSSDDGVHYGAVIQALDLVKASGIVSVGISTD